MNEVGSLMGPNSPSASNSSQLDFDENVNLKRGKKMNNKQKQENENVFNL